MKKKLMSVLIFSLALLIVGCGTIENTQKSKDDTKKVDEPKESASNREIIAELEQTVDETPKRDALAKEQTESDEYKEGMLGEPSPELAEDTAVQAIEGPTTIEAAEEIYGGYEGVNKAGIIFFENQMSGAEQSGIWFGIKEPDERLDELVALLQSKVDAGEILAEPIYFYKSGHTQEELNHRLSEVNKAMKQEEQERGSYSVSVDTITGDIEIGHDFLKEEEQQKLREEFPDYTLQFEQEGNMVAEPGEPTTTYPEEEYTTKPSKEGGYVMQVDDGGMLVIAAEPDDFSETGGQEEFFNAISYTYEEAEMLNVGQRVHVEITGGVMESYPGQATAKFVEVLPEYKPDGANLSESEVVRKAIQKKKSDYMVIIRSLSFDEKTSTWAVELKQEEEIYEVKVKDE